MPYTLALVGAPNTGKSTLFNALCGTCVPTGNREGVTVEVMRKKARVGDERYEVVDLPGIRRLPPRAPDERLSLAHLQSSLPDLIIFVVDATRPAQGLSLAFALMRRLRGGCSGCATPCGAQTERLRCLIALNYCDRLAKQGIVPHTSAVLDTTGIPTVAISAVRGQGMDDLAQSIGQVLRAPVPAYRVPSGQAQIDALITALLGKPPVTQASEMAADRILARRLTGIPVFLVLFALMLWLCMGGPGKWASDLFLDLLVDPLVALIQNLTAYLPSWLSSLLCDGVLVGAGTVLSFLPGLSLLFACLCIMEQSGLLARCAYVADRPMRKIGLSGQVFVAVLLGWGCTVPAVMSLRTVASASQRRRAALLLPLISCTARLPVYLMIGSMCGLSGWSICIVAYVLGVGMFCVLSWLLSGKNCVNTEPVPSLPPYRMPRLTEIVRQVRERSFAFVVRVGSTVLLCSVLVWLLSHLTLGLRYTEDMAQSVLYMVSEYIAYLLAPIGLGESGIVSSLLCGVLAKESIVSTLGVLYGGDVAGVLSQAQGVSFAVFGALYCPCVATMSVIYRETRSVWAVVQSIAIGICSAYFVAGIAYYGMLLWQKNFA